ncbi:MAG: sensor histidine kinase [Saprospiraceae bacterium]|nr:sensor histidine kinase [Saprospiraceae bacterium]
MTLDSALLWMASNYEENPSPFHLVALKTLHKAYVAGDEQKMGEAHLWLMRWHAYHVPFINDSIYYHGEKALVFLQRAGDRSTLAAAQSELAFEYVEENEMFRSEELILTAIKTYEELGDTKGLGSAYSKMCSVQLAQEESDAAIRYGLQAVQFAEEAGDQYTTAFSWRILIEAFLQANEYERAVDAGNKSIELIQRHAINDTFMLARAHAYRGDAFSALENYPAAVEDNAAAYRLVKAKIGEERPAAQTYRIGIGQAYYNDGDYRNALPHMEAAVQGYTDLGQNTQPKMEVYYNQLADCYFQLGYYDKAFASKNLEHQVSDTMLADKIRNLESENLIKYETGKKDQALDAQAQTISQKNRIQRLGMGLIAMLLLFLATLYFYYQRSRRMTSLLERKNEENELLLKEIHHRVKNNLQVISSLLNMQSRSLTDDALQEVIRKSQSRVQSMSLIHQKLYRGKNLAVIEMKSYLETLADHLLEAYSKEDEIDVQIEMNPLELDVDYAIPVGLIINELMTNSLKYAFGRKKHGVIDISLQQEGDEMVLDVGDNGDGKAAIIDPKMSSGFGSELVEMLTTQLKGRVTQEAGEGFRTQLRFPITSNMQAA